MGRSRTTSRVLLRGVPRRSARSRRRAVSPVVATILLVAISFVLAAVLYLLVGHVAAGGSTATPLGSTLALGPAQLMQGSTPTDGYCQSGHYCYAVSVASSSGKATLGDLGFRVQTTQGTSWKVTQDSARLAIVGIDGVVLASSNFSKNASFALASFASYEHGGTSTTELTSSMTLYVQFELTSSPPSGEGLQLLVYGTGPLTGSIATPLP